MLFQNVGTSLPKCGCHAVKLSRWWWWSISTSTSENQIVLVLFFLLTNLMFYFVYFNICVLINFLEPRKAPANWWHSYMMKEGSLHAQIRNKMSFSRCIRVHVSMVRKNCFWCVNIGTTLNRWVEYRRGNWSSNDVQT